MGYYDAYNAILSVQKSTPRDSRIALTKRSIESDFFASPSYYRVDAYLPSTPLSSTPLEVWILDDSDSKFQKQFISHPSQELDSGYLFYWPDMDQYYLTYIADKNLGDIYSRGTAMRCFSSIRWLDSDGNIREAWFCQLNTNSSTLGLNDGQVLIMPSERRQITVQNNQFTELINKEQRFIFDGRAWRTLNVDRLIDGIITLTVEEHQIDPARDNVDLRIADYYNSVHEKIIKILNGDFIQLSVGDITQLNVQVIDNGIVVDKPIEFESSDESIATVDENGLIVCLSEGNVVITASLTDDNKVFSKINIQVNAVAEDNYVITISGSDVCKSNQTQTYTAEVRNNGVVDNSKSVEWSLLADDKSSSTALALITLQTGTSCTIKANNNQQYGYVQLQARLIDDETVISFKRIQIKGLF